MTIKSYQTVESHQHRRHVDLQTESFGAQVCVCVCVLLLRYQLQPALDTQKIQVVLKEKGEKGSCQKLCGEHTQDFISLSRRDTRRYIPFCG